MTVQTPYRAGQSSSALPDNYFSLSSDAGVKRSLCFFFLRQIFGGGGEQQLDSVHGIDENVDVETLAPAVDFYRYIIKEA